MSLEARFAAAMAELVPEEPRALGLSISGGGDSTALLHLAAGWARGRDISLWVLTIDHNLRPAARIEAAAVAAQSRDLDLPHATLRWAGWDGQGNLQDAARRARHGLIDRWRGGVRQILTGHTADDQAETVLLNLARGSGVDGLAGMSATSPIRPPLAVEPVASNGEGPPPDPGRAPGFVILRPLLEMRREELRDWLGERGLSWAEDPSNDDDRFDRVRARKLLAAAAPLGLETAGLTATATRMARARAALEARTRDAAMEIADVQSGDIVLDRDGLAALDAETRLRLLSLALVWVSSADYRPRAKALDQLASDALEGRHGALHGCLLRAGPERIRILREEAAVAAHVLPASTDGPVVWDNRWRIGPAPEPDLQIGPLGAAGVRAIGGAPKGGLPRLSLLASPALRRTDGELIAAPLAGWGAKTRLFLDPPWGDFASSAMSH
ncbi:tRNA lysidine(34) synthetase TilS [Tropicimonas sp. IMCC34011]|uniref:tRNA lysidine(34) synthetase TilS n=1 Tax=Tropicimonas sp. IMCC34011 TaxID=2248759 RepID=UPI0013003A0E|nr:tRNA lysidine(34) synthetase TilS [Tropicimonas sp. IMCC34011]